MPNRLPGLPALLCSPLPGPFRLRPVRRTRAEACQPFLVHAGLSLLSLPQTHSSSPAARRKAPLANPSHPAALYISAISLSLQCLSLQHHPLPNTRSLPPRRLPPARPETRNRTHKPPSKPIPGCPFVRRQASPHPRIGSGFGVAGAPGTRCGTVREMGREICTACPVLRGRQTGVRMKGTPPGRVGEQEKANYY